MKTTPTSASSKVFIYVYALFFVAAVAFGIVSHSGSEVIVTFRNGQVDAQQAFSALWGDIAAKASDLNNNCHLYGGMGVIGIGPASVTSAFGVPDGYSHSAAQITLVIGGQSTTAQGAVDSISTSIKAINDNYVKFACHAYCSGNKYVAQATCVGPNDCGSAYAHPDLTTWCDYGCQVQYDNVNPATGGCLSQPANTCDGASAERDYRCTTNDPTSCHYQTIEDCAATGQICQNGQCVNPPQQQSSSGTVAAGGGCDRVNGPFCQSGLFCYDGADPDTVGVCTAPNSGAACTVSTQCYSGVCQASGTCQ